MSGASSRSATDEMAGLLSMFPTGRSSKAKALELLAAGIERDIAARDNVVLGLYAEALVALALAGELEAHRWEVWDCVGPDGGRIQVKTSTGMGIGKAADAPASTPSWRGFKPGARWLVETNEFEAMVEWHADVWVLARVEGLDPFDDDAWSFFVLSRDTVRAIAAQSASAARLRDLGHHAVLLPALAAEYARVRSSTAPT